MCRRNRADLGLLSCVFLFILSAGEYGPHAKPEPYTYQQSKDKTQDTVICKNELSNVRLPPSLPLAGVIQSQALIIK
ncbi:MAG: hypothetical protein A4E65_00655 [Syntrophorhabdus sp. PtaU1.Bin153]|nr:MAG: hypothetical protein A4E65_00655 [Syntrophorhabdus sp. PtaU1.Bin153]